MLNDLRRVDHAVYEAVMGEVRRQHVDIELIASENYVSMAVLDAVGSVMTNKYAEGLPGRRYYGGCEFADVVENLAIDRAKQLFGADHVNVQPHSGSQANMAVYFSRLAPGDRILGMALDHGGHLSHGHPKNFSSRVFDIARRLKPSARGELEITDVNNAYIEAGAMSWEVLAGWWTDAGTFESLYRATRLVADGGANKLAGF